MQHVRSLDSVVRARLRRWPQCPPGLGAGPKEIWLRGRPAEGTGTCQPFLKLPGSDRLRTLPDGLWLHFGGTPAEPFADIFAIEACSTLQNLLDKRSRFAPSTSSLLAFCPVPWLLAPAQRSRLLPIWRVAGWLTGALPALVGPAAVQVTIEAVETFVDHHYQEQIDRLPAAGEAGAVRALLEQCRLEEVEHRDEAAELLGAERGWLARLWGGIVGRGSAAAVAAARRI